MSAVPVAFYAPLKPPDHPIPSGDRTMARLLLAALTRAGFAPTLASRLRTHEPAGDEVRQREIAKVGKAEAARLATAYETCPPQTRPRLWFTYHCYYKAPDHLGPALAHHLGIPLVMAEASRAPKRASGPWHVGHAAAEAAIDAADILLVLTGQDRECLEQAAPPGQQLVRLPPFVDSGACPPSPERMGTSGPPRLLTAAMMREGDKLASYRLLAGALERIGELPWTLDIVGDGPARSEVERLFAPFGTRVTFQGRQDGADLAALYGGADLFVWPAVNEAYGMALLEAQLQGCPVIAGGYGGVAEALVPGVTGLLTPPGDPEAFADAIATLLAEPERRAVMGAAAQRFVSGERTLDAAADILRRALYPLVGLPAAA